MTTIETTVANLTLTPLPAPLTVPPGAEAIVADGPGYPVRRCLRDAEIGETVLLISYDPWRGDSPYRQSGPIFVHAEPCAYTRGPHLPVQLTSRLLSVRAVDAQHRMIDADVVGGEQLAEVTDRFFADARVSYLHVHNAGPGCFAVRVDRP